MRCSAVKVPASLLLDRELPGSVKLLWLARQLALQEGQVPSAAILETYSGLSRHTVLRGVARLEAGGWLSTRGGRTRTLTIPPQLLLDLRLGIQARLLYGALQLTPGFSHPTGQTTYAELATPLGLHPKSVRAATLELHGSGWVQIRQHSKFSPIHFTLCHPMPFGDVALVERRLAEANFQGETIMQEYLSLIVESEEFEENARPGFLVNPYTDERMEFDRYYPPKVAFEFNGDQHYGPTERYPNEADAWRQQGRDLMKIGICVRRGITLVTIHAEDLSLAVMRQKVEGLLPLRDLTGLEPLITLLEEAGRGYRKGWRHHRRSKPD